MDRGTNFRPAKDRRPNDDGNEIEVTFAFIGNEYFGGRVAADRARAAAQIDPWEFEVYPTRTESRGMIEIESDNAYIANGHSQGGNGTAAGTFRSQGMWYSGEELDLRPHRPHRDRRLPQSLAAQADMDYGGRATSFGCAADSSTRRCCRSISDGTSTGMAQDPAVRQR